MAFPCHTGSRKKYRINAAGSVKKPGVTGPVPVQPWALHQTPVVHWIIFWGSFFCYKIRHFRREGINRNGSCQMGFFGLRGVSGVELFHS